MAKYASFAAVRDKRLFAGGPPNSVKKRPALGGEDGPWRNLFAERHHLIDAGPSVSEGVGQPNLGKPRPRDGRRYEEVRSRQRRHGGFGVDVQHVVDVHLQSHAARRSQKKTLLGAEVQYV